MKSLFWGLLFYAVPVLLAAQNITTQNNWILDVSIGTALPTGAFGRTYEATEGQGIQAGATFPINNFFRMGFRAGFTLNPVEEEEIRTGLVSFAQGPVENLRTDNFMAFQLSFAPQMGTFSESLHIALMPQLGYQLMSRLDLEYAVAAGTEPVNLRLAETYGGAWTYGLGLLLGKELLGTLELGMLINYLAANHNSETTVTVSDSTLGVNVQSAGTLNYRSLQLMTRIGYRF